MLLNWFEDEELLQSGDVIAAACLALGVLSQSSSNEELVHASDGVSRLLNVMAVLSGSAAVQENAMFAIGTLAKVRRQRLTAATTPI